MFPKVGKMEELHRSPPPPTPDCGRNGPRRRARLEDGNTPTVVTDVRYTHVPGACTIHEDVVDIAVIRVRIQSTVVSKGKSNGTREVGDDANQDKNKQEMTKAVSG